MKTLIVVLVLLLTFIYCRKGIEHDNEYIRGRLFLTDTITTNKREIPIANKNVLICRRGDTLNYIYSTKTDDEGYFIFDLLTDENEQYTLISHDTIGSYIYKGMIDVKRGDKQVVLVLNLAQYSQNALVLYATDSLNGILPAVSIKIFNNPELAAINDSSNVFAKLITDLNGKAYMFNLPAGDYYINAEKRIGADNYFRSLKKIRLNAKGFVIDSIILTRKAALNTLSLGTMDSLTGVLPTTELYLFNSQVLASESISVGSIKSIITDQYGIGYFSNIEPGYYFVNAQKIINDSVKYERRVKAFYIPISGLIKDTLVLRRRIY